MHRTYAPFGQEDAVAGDPAGMPAHFAGHLADEDSGLVYMQARWYDAAGGTFLSIDPLVADAGDPQSYNAYSYVRNNPISYTDPTGMCLGGLFNLTCDPRSHFGRTPADTATLAPVSDPGQLPGLPNPTISVRLSFSFGGVAQVAGGDSIAQVQTSQPSQSGYTPAPPELIGTRDYYLWRYENAPESYRNDTGREYYLDYGLRKFDDFQRLREGASPELQDFIDRTGRELQLGLESRLQQDPSIGLRRGSLYRAAIDVHSDAYKAGGFWGLPPSDKLKVLKTIGPDLLRPETIREGIESILP